MTSKNRIGHGVCLSLLFPLLVIPAPKEHAGNDLAAEAAGDAENAAHDAADSAQEAVDSAQDARDRSENASDDIKNSADDAVDQGESARDAALAMDAFWHFLMRPRSGEIYNIGGGRQASCSVLEAIDLPQRLTGQLLNWTYEEQNRIGDHVWWISDVRHFRSHHPQWDYRYNLEILSGKL